MPVASSSACTTYKSTSKCCTAALLPHLTMPYPFVYPNPFTTPPWGPSSNEHRSLPPQAGLPWGGWQPSHLMTRPYPDTSPWTAPSPLQPSLFLHNTPVPQPTFIQSSHPSPQGYQPSPQYCSVSTVTSQPVTHYGLKLQRTAS